MNLYYNKYMSKDEVERRAEKYGFPDTRLVEKFVFDFEVFRELQDISDSFILKGGAAAQLYLPIEEQRASVDVDLVTNLNPKRIDNSFKQLRKPLEAERYTPKEPNPNLPLMTYYIEHPSKFSGKEGPSTVKADVFVGNLHSYETKTIWSKKLFALDTEFPLKCISLGSLIADKFLTLAMGSVGIPEERINDIPKQVYDLSKLTKYWKEKDLSDFYKTFHKLAEAELEFRNLKYRINEIAEHIDKFLVRFNRIDVGESQVSPMFC